MSQYSPSQEKQLPPHPPPAWNRWTDGWLPEIVAAIFGSLCFMGLIVMLLQCDGKPNFDWHGVTVNALVALLSTLSRACLMVALAGAISQVKWVLFTKSPRRLYDFEVFDLASRDAWGRLQLLCRSPLGLASIGALGAILALAFDPFAQQLVSTRVVVQFGHDDSATIGHAVRYSAGHVTYQWPLVAPATCNSTSTDAPMIRTADFNMQSAIWNGIGSKDALNKTVQQLAPTCPSGNCTWPAFDSLAVCSRCADVSSSLVQSESDNLQYQLLNQNSGGLLRRKGSTKFTLPNGVYLETQNSWRWSGNSQNLTGIETTLLASYGTTEPSETIAFQDIDTLIWSMSVLRARPRQPSTAELAKPYIPEAMECALYYCVNSYTSSMTNGVLTEEAELSPTKSQRDPTSWQPLMDAKTYNNDRSPTRTVALNTPSFVPTLTAAQAHSLGGGACIAYTPRSDLRLGDAFNISQSAISSISSFVNSSFAIKTYLAEQQGPEAGNETVITGRVNAMGVSVHGLLQWQPPSMEPLFETDSLDLTFQKIARSMSNSIRTNSDNSTVIQGDTGAIKIQVDVRWPWIALPAVVLAITIVQLALSIHYSKTAGAPIWKSSSLASLSRGNHVPESIKAASTVGAMERIARDHHVDIFDRDLSRAGTLYSPVKSLSRDDVEKGHHWTWGGFFAKHPAEVSTREDAFIVNDSSGRCRR